MRGPVCLPPSPRALSPPGTPSNQDTQPRVWMHPALPPGPAAQHPQLSGSRVPAAEPSRAARGCPRHPGTRSADKRVRPGGGPAPSRGGLAADSGFGARTRPPPAQAWVIPPAHRAGLAGRQQHLTPRPRVAHGGKRGHPHRRRQPGEVLRLWGRGDSEAEKAEVAAQLLRSRSHFRRLEPQARSLDLADPRGGGESELEHPNFPVRARSPALKPRKPTQPTSDGRFWSDSPDFHLHLAPPHPCTSVLFKSPPKAPSSAKAFPNLPCSAQDTLFRLPLKHLLWGIPGGLSGNRSACFHC